MIVIADSGSTKTDWLICGENPANGEKEIRLSSMGLNPYHLTVEKIMTTVEETFADVETSEISKVFFYGAGCNSAELNAVLYNALTNVFSKSSVEIHSDIEGAARALFGRKKGIAVILGTGSNTVVYDGYKIVEGIQSLGYILGDEGSGAAIGKSLLQMYFHGKMEAALKADFEKDFALDLKSVLLSVYKKPGPNRYLASFAIFAGKHAGEPSIAAMLDDIFEEYFKIQLLPLARKYHYPLGVVGSIGHHFANIFAAKADKYGFELMQILKKPVEKLKEYHLNEL